MSNAPKPCGLYKTTGPVGPIHADRLVYFHNHSPGGGAVAHAPRSNTRNRWTFDSTAHPVAPEELAALVALKPEGLYRVTEHFHPDDTRIVPKNALVQLGYNREAEPIVFFPARADGINGIEFPTHGMRIPDAVYDLLEPLDLRGPYEPTTVH